jgi:hypothetical protein
MIYISSVNHHMTSLACQSHGDLLSNASAGTSHQRPFILQFPHSFLLAYLLTSVSVAEGITVASATLQLNGALSLEPFYVQPLGWAKANMTAHIDQ